MFSWQAAGKIASHSIQELFIRAYEPCFFRTLSLSPSPRISVGNMKIRWKFYNFTIFSRDSRIVRKIRKFEKFCYNYCVRVQQPIVTSVGILNIFFDILTKVGCIVHERTGVYSKHFTPRKERNAFNLGR